MPKSCCAVGCHNHNMMNDRKLSFFTFPSKDTERRERWINAVKKLNPDGSKGNPGRMLSCVRIISCLVCYKASIRHSQGTVQLSVCNSMKSNHMCLAVSLKQITFSFQTNRARKTVQTSRNCRPPKIQPE